MLQRIGSFIGWVGTALVFGAVGVRLFKPEWHQNAQYAAWAGLACVFIYMATQWKDIARSLSRRQTRLSSIALSTVVVVLALLVGVNYLASRRNKRWDLTANQQFSLSDQTRQILQKLDAPVKVMVFDRPVEFDKFRDRLNEYAYVSKQVSVDYVDVDKQPVLANQNQVQSYGTVVFNYKGRTERVVSAEEQQLTNGLIKLITGAQRTVYFLQGHGEKDIASSERGGYSEIASGLQSDNFKTAPLVLAQAGAIPADATVIVIAGPSTDLLAPEVDLLKKYLDGGGKLLVMADPPRKADETPFTNLTSLLHDWAIDLGNNVVVDVSGVGQLLGTDASVPVAAPPYPSHPIGQGFNLLTAYPLTRSVTPVGGGVNGRTAQTFIQTSTNSWGETNLAEMFTTRKVENDKAKDQQGPISIAAAVAVPVAGAPAPPPAPGQQAKEEAPKPETRMAVIGDSDFASNSLLGIQGNRDMFLNTLNWLSQQENLISIRPKDPQDRRLTMTAGQQVAVRWLALLVVPAVIWGAGIYNWSRRRG